MSPAPMKKIYLFNNKGQVGKTAFRIYGCLNWCGIKNKSNNTGQALVTLIFFTVIAIMIATASISIITGSSTATGSIEQEETSYYTAESGVENAILRLLRDPNYTGETLSINNGTATITVTGSNPYTITSIGSLGVIKRTVQVVVSYNNNILSITSWKTIE